MNGARPRPASGIELKVPQGGLVDLDEDDVPSRESRSGGARQTPVVGLQLKCVERRRADATRGDPERRVGAEHEYRGTDADEHTRHWLVHVTDPGDARNVQARTPSALVPQELQGGAPRASPG